MSDFWLGFIAGVAVFVVPLAIYGLFAWLGDEGDWDQL